MFSVNRFEKRDGRVDRELVGGDLPYLESV